MKRDFYEGLHHGFPVFLGYVPVSFTFGLMTVSLGLPKWAAILISLTNLTSAGQFAGLNLIAVCCSYFELGLTVFIINLRYMLMSLSLALKIDPNTPTLQRMLFSFGITDETYVLASLRPNKVTSAYMFGLISLPIVGWNLGTILGVFISDFMPAPLQSACGIALYAMFIALIVPQGRKDFKTLKVVLIAVAISCFLTYVPVVNNISSGFKIILSAVAASALGAYFFPRKEDAA